MLITRYPTSAGRVYMASIPHFEAVKFTNDVAKQAYQLCVASSFAELVLPRPEPPMHSITRPSSAWADGDKTIVVQCVWLQF